MSRPKKEIPPAREHFIGLRVTEDQYEVIAAEAKKAHLSVSEYIRRVLAGHPIKTYPPVLTDHSRLGDALMHIGKISGNLNQLMRFLNQGGTLTDDIRQELSSLVIDLYEIRDNVNRIIDEDYKAR